MKLSKLKKLHVIIIGSVMCVLAGVALFFLVVKPQNEALAAAKARYDTAVVLGNQSKLGEVQNDLIKADIEVAQAQQKLDEEMRRCMPDLSFARRDTGMLALWNEQIKTLGPLLESFAKDPKCKVLVSGFKIPAPPVNPNDPIFDQDVLVFPLGAVAAMGDFKQLMDNVRRWNKCGRLIMVGPPQVAGQSPQLAAGYSLTCYIFPVDKGGEKIPLAGAGDQVAQR